jgi:hypothetical protein
MMRYFLLVKYFISILLLISFSASAQFLPDNKTLNSQSLERWMQSAAAMSPVVELIDSMHLTDDAIKQFDALPAVEQDQKIQQFLSQKQQADVANQIAKQYGWKSPGEFRRWSTRLGNAIAAYFSKKDMQGLTAEQIKQLREKMDAAILAVPESDIDFVQQHEKQLQRYIQSYGK